VRRSPFGIQIRNAAGRVVLDSLEGGALPSNDVGTYRGLGSTHRAVVFGNRILEGWDYQTATDRPWLTTTRVVQSSSSATTANLVLTDATGAALMRVAIVLDGQAVRLDATVNGQTAPNDPSDRAMAGLNAVGMAFRLPPEEHFFGLGERFVTVDHRGRHYQDWVEEGGIGLGEDAGPGPNNPAPNGPSMTHAPVPFLLSTKGYGLWQETTYRSAWSLGAESPDAWRLYAAEPALHLRVLVHDDPRDTIAHFTQLTGRAQLPAPWVFGPRRRTDRNAMVGGIPETQALRDQGVPTTMVDDTTHFLPIGSEVGEEAELTQWTAAMHAQGYKAIAYYNAYVSVTDSRAADLVAAGRANGYFVRLDDGSEFDTIMISAGPQTVATIDMTNSAAVAWYQSLLQRALDLGYDGWMLDFGEYLPPNAKMSDGRSGWEAHNAFPVLYQKATFDYLRQQRGDDFMFFARAGFTGSQAFAPVIWSGDPAASFDDAKGLPANVRAGINAGLSGIPFWGSDISGYTCLHDPPADKEVYLRWTEFGALSTDMHDENACAAAPQGQTKWTLWSDEETTRVYGDYARLHTRLFPYTYAAAKEATLTGLPIMRHPMLLHPAEPEAWKSEFDYWYGPSLYVAPVVRRGAVTRDVWLPPGRWVDWFTLEPLTGGAHVTRPAPLSSLPLFLRSGGIVPLLDPSVQTLAPATDPGVVDLDKVTGILDVRAAVDPLAPAASILLVDGTKLEVTLGAGAPALPADVPSATAEADLATCGACALVEAMSSGVSRVRISKQSTDGTTLVAGSLTLRYAGAGGRIRWDVAVLAR
jgi:alpha-glucosidase (family GH31 glycosyl hydrolase)